MAPQKRRILGFAAAVVIFGSIVGFNLVRENRKRVEVQTQKVARRDLVSLVTASGEVKPKRYVNVGANVSGRIVVLAVKEGDRVKKGQVLARIESERYEAGARQSEAAVLASLADLDRALADLDVSKLVFERTKKMHAEKLISDQAFDQAEAEVKMKAAAVDATRKRVLQLKAQLDSTRDDLNKTTVISPMDGVVTSLPKEEGEVVIGAQSFNPTVHHDRGRPVGHGVRDHGGRDRHPQRDPRPARGGAGGRAGGGEDQGRGHGDRLLRHPSRHGHRRRPRPRPAATPATRPRTSRSRSPSKDPPSSLRPGLNATADITTATPPACPRRPHPGGGGARARQGGQDRRPRRHALSGQRRQHGAHRGPGQGRGEGRRLRGGQRTRPSSAPSRPGSWGTPTSRSWTE